MSHSLASTKSVCPRCQRTVHVAVIEGARVFLDVEIMSVVLVGERQARKRAARRSHAELCDSYQRAAAAKKARRT